MNMAVTSIQFALTGVYIMTETENTETGIYQVGLRRDEEAVISSHFMHEINCDKTLSLYRQERFLSIALTINEKLIFDDLITVLLDTSDKFIRERIVTVKYRVRRNFCEYGLTSFNDVGLAEMITEVMFDQQFFKGYKSNVSRFLLRNQISNLIKEEKPIKMVIPALPFKSSCPLKSRGNLPELAEVNFLLALVEIAKTIDLVYKESMPKLTTPMAMFTVICDGSRFSEILHESAEVIREYQNCLQDWIARLGISNFIEIVDYHMAISSNLKTDLLREKNTIREHAYLEYQAIVAPLLNHNDMLETLKKTMKLDPDPEQYSKEGRFVPLFKSILYTMNYRILKKISDLFKINYISLYKELTEHIFEPYTQLTDEDVKKISSSILYPDTNICIESKQFLEYLRHEMLNEAWSAAIKYIAEIKSDRDLPVDPVVSCFPEHIRWTIHSKPGQLGVQTTTAFGDPVQAWHGMGVFKLSNKNKIKLYTLPTLFLEGSGAVPVIPADSENFSFINKYNELNQPLFYIYPDIPFTSMEDFLSKLKNMLTRTRKS